MKTIDVVAAVLLGVGGLNWGLVAAADLDLVAAAFGVGSLLSKSAYGLMGLAALYQGMNWKAIQSRWQWRLATAGERNSPGARGVEKWKLTHPSSW
jgi:uncharacterized membrane protein YuzA (DUF378 family)